MNKIKIKAEVLLDIVRNIFNSIDYTIENTDTEWDNKKVTDILNIEYFAFKHRVKPASDYLESISKSLNQSYCLCELLTAKRLFSKDIDHLTIAGNLTMWVQTNKLKLLESFIEDCNMELGGDVVSVQIGGEERNMLIEFSAPRLQNTQGATEIGEASIVSISIQMELAPSINSYNDYKFELSFDNGQTYLTAPYTAWTYTYNTSQVPMPLANKSDSGFLNVTQSNSISLNLYDFNKELTRKLREIALSCNEINQATKSLNQQIYLKIIIDSVEWVYRVTAKTITINGINTTFNTMAVVFSPGGVV